MHRCLDISAVKSMLLSLLVFLSASTCCYGHGDSIALTFELRDNEKQCFYQDWAEVKTMMFAFRVLRGGNRDVDVSIESPAARDVYSVTKQTNGQTQMETGWGTFTFCFSNEFSAVSHKVVFFELRSIDHDSLADEAGRKRPFVDTQVEHSMEQIHANNENTKTYQNDYRVREAKGKDIADNLNHVVSAWSALEAMIILIISYKNSIGCIESKLGQLLWQIPPIVINYLRISFIGY